MEDDFPTIDALARRLIEIGALSPGQLDEFKRLEMSSITSARKEDALMLYGRLPDSDPAKEAMSKGLEDLRSWIRDRLDGAASSSPPKLLFVSGAPGSGKSSLLEEWSRKNPGSLVANADDFKGRFKERLHLNLADTPEPTRSNLSRSVYIHRLTAMPSWEMVDRAIDDGKNLAVEMLGMGAVEDARTLRRALAKGYQVEAWHVGCTVEQSSARAAQRYFDQKKIGQKSRWIGLAQAAGKQKAIVSSFAQLCELMKGTGAKMRLFDNTGSRVKLAWTSDEASAPPVEKFSSWHSDPKLWRPGPNPAADLCAFAPDGKGGWSLALIERSHEPCKGFWAFPGGFVKGASHDGEFEWGPEEAKQAALRRFSEETLSDLGEAQIVFVGKFDSIERDPRNSPNRWVESWLFAAKLESQIALSGGDAASSAKWVDANLAMSGQVQMAFDHQKLLEQAWLALAQVESSLARGAPPAGPA